VAKRVEEDRKRVFEYRRLPRINPLLDYLLYYAKYSETDEVELVVDACFILSFWPLRRGHPE
jgi:hypothetical protein